MDLRQTYEGLGVRSLCASREILHCQLRFVVHCEVQLVCIKHPYARPAVLSTCLIVATDLTRVLQKDSIVGTTFTVLVESFYIMLCRCPKKSVTALSCWNWLPT